jgi:hypothetical protein
MEQTRPVLTTVNCLGIIPTDNVKSGVRKGSSSTPRSGGKGR